MKAVKVNKKDAESARSYLVKQKAFDSSYMVKKEGNFVLIPVKKETKKYKTIEAKLQRYNSKPKSLRDALLDKLTKEEMEHLKTSYDTIGSIAILEIAPELKEKEKLIANTLLETNGKIKTVLAKAGIHSGEFRTQKMKHLAGKRTKESTVVENGVRLTLDVEKVYFSVRLSTERKRIMELVKPRERVLVMFSGCAPYPCVLSKNTQAKEIVGIELNPEGHKYGKLNVETNKLTNIKLYNEDARKAAKHGKFDRILMPLPKNSEEFLADALKAARKGTVVHLYTFGSEEELEDRKKQIRTTCKDAGHSIRINNVVRCGQFSPRTYRQCIDFRIL